MRLKNLLFLFTMPALLVLNAHAQDLVCPPVEVVFAMDTSGSMSNEAQALCDNISAVQGDLAALGVTSTTFLYGITQTRSGGFSCLTDDVENLFGPEVPGDGGACGQSLNQNESWGEAIAILANDFPWSAGAVRVIVPISDEGPCNGNSCVDPGSDRDAITNAIAQATLNNVFVSPILGQSSSSNFSCVTTLAQDVATATGGTAFESSDPTLDLAGGLSNLIVQACIAANNPPTAQCQNVTVAADGSCQASASVNNGTSDADGDPLTITESPAGPYALGDTIVTLTATDPDQASDSCEGTVSVIDVTSPTIDCGVSSGIDGGALPQAYTATLMDNCSALGTPQVTSFSCSKVADGGAVVDTTSECDITLNGATATVNAIGSSTQVEWIVQGLDQSQNPVTKICSNDAAPVIVPESPDSITVSCVPSDTIGVNFEMDGNAAQQRGLIRRMLRVLKRSSGKRKYRRFVSTYANETYTEAWASIWSVPTQTLQCEPNTACVDVAYSDAIDRSLRESQELHNIATDVRQVFKTSRDSRRGTKRIVRWHSQSLGLLNENRDLSNQLPQINSLCGEGVTVLLDGAA